ncbi:MULTISPECIES: hypothetical protein [unclassified Pseudomonas]|uniref:hypothetical protein n=1 Tax=unclassified Pseudomonas TaxID=196821 RepID=UPI0011B25AC0|nr:MULTISPECIES: hypothetical protein [unclassified Pseudomonas]
MIANSNGKVGLTASLWAQLAFLLALLFLSLSFIALHMGDRCADRFHLHNHEADVLLPKVLKNSFLRTHLASHGFGA